MIRVGEKRAFGSPVRRATVQASAHEDWVNQYGVMIAEQLRPEKLYSLIRVGGLEFAYTDFEKYLRALGQVWEAGLVPEPLPSTMGRDLTAVAPNLCGIDLDLRELDLGARERRFRSDR